MREKEFNGILKRVVEFSNQQRLKMYEVLDHSGDYKAVCDFFEKRFEENRCCPHCSSKELVRNGIKSGLTRYLCKSCRKTCNALYGTPFARLRKKELWLSYLRSMLSSETIRRSAGTLNVNKNTAFKWRHRFLLDAHSDKPPVLSGVVEADETYFRKNKKGQRNLKRPARKRGEKAPTRGISREHVSVLVTCDRTSGEADYITGAGPVSGKWLDMFLKRRISQDTLLVTNYAKSYAAFSSHQHITHVRLNSSKKQRSNGPYHIQHVNAYHSTMKRWIRRFKGVATKYLPHYLGWCHELFSRRVQSAEEMLQVLVMSSVHT